MSNPFTFSFLGEEKEIFENFLKIVFADLIRIIKIEKLRKFARSYTKIDFWSILNMGEQLNDWKAWAPTRSLVCFQCPISPLAMKLKITRIKIHKETQEKKINIKSKFKKKLTEIHKILKIFIFRRELHDKFL